MKTQGQHTVQGFVHNLVHYHQPGYVPMGTEVATLIPDILKDFESLCMLPIDQRERWCTDLKKAKDTNSDPDRGLLVRDTPDKDLKHILQCRPSLGYELALNGVPIEEHQMFLNRMQVLWDICFTKVSEIGRALDQELPGFSFEQKLTMHPDSHVLRLLRYSPGRDYFAKPHFDVGFLTLPLHESLPGLYVERSPVVHLPGHAFGFLGLKAQLMTDMLGLAPDDFFTSETWLGDQSSWLLPHLHHAQNVAQQKVRYAVVYFAHVDVGLELELMSLLQKKKVASRQRPNL
jgi:hypothetical protein